MQFLWPIGLLLLGASLGGDNNQIRPVRVYSLQK